MLLFSFLHISVNWAVTTLPCTVKTHHPRISGRFRMLTCWLIFTAFLSSLVSPNTAIVAVAPVCQVEAQCKAKVTLQCGDGNMAGQ